MADLFFYVVDSACRWIWICYPRLETRAVLDAILLALEVRLLILSAIQRFTLYLYIIFVMCSS